MNTLAKNINQKFDSIFLLKFLFYSFPIILFFPSFIINLHVSLILIFGLIAIYKRNLKIKIISVDLLVLLFFFLFFLSTLINITTLNYVILIKSILNFRFFLFFFIIRNLLITKIVNLKLLSSISLTSSIALTLDIFIQHFLGYDIFGFPPFENRFNGFFEHEAIAGSYLQKFFFLSLLSIFLFNQKKIKLTIMIIFSINLVGLGILLSFDRMPFLLFILSLLLFFIFLKNYRILFLSNILILIGIFIFLFSNYPPLKIRYTNLASEFNYNKILNILSIKKNITENKEKLSAENQKLLHGDYTRLYRAALAVFSENYLIGSGLRSFSYECLKILNDNNNFKCSNHPHNLYFEIIVSSGLIGLLIFTFILFFSINKIVKNCFNNNLHEIIRTISIFFLIYFIVELIPFRSFGSLFQTINGHIFWFFLALLNYVKNIEVEKKNLTKFNKVYI